VAGIGRHRHANRSIGWAGKKKSAG
jgi:hypothetical protein